ncbi:hypothetical protein [Ideonella alba]|uniref:Uncharacterized protein n=1 Tax=Ideonella alba TaxID=2824118 RepID=A0A940Y3P7_9BURK|nr:hypothetical protein [Ideonella alba]MBQ0929167.1 hypothetical protein [Ideonella alba]
MVNKGLPKTARARNVARAKRMTSGQEAPRGKWLDMLGSSKSSKPDRSEASVASVAVAGVEVRVKAKRTAPSRGRRHLVLAPAIRSRRVDPDDLDAAVLSVV